MPLSPHIAGSDRIAINTHGLLKLRGRARTRTGSVRLGWEALHIHIHTYIYLAGLRAPLRILLVRPPTPRTRMHAGVHACMTYLFVIRTRTKRI